MTAHLNRIKAWNAPNASILRVVVADEDDDEQNLSTTNWQTLLDPQQRADVAQLLYDFSDRLDGSLGEGKGLLHAIDTNCHAPV